jgi:predicted nucleic acid-binding Zn ribbon protein
MDNREIHKRLKEILGEARYKEIFPNGRTRDRAEIAVKFLELIFILIVVLILFLNLTKGYY